MPIRQVPPSLDIQLIGSPVGIGAHAATPKHATPKSSVKSVPPGLLERRRQRGLKLNCVAVREEDRAPCGSCAARPSQVIEDYAILEELGQGSCGVVHRARRAVDGKEVALKTMRSVDAEHSKILREEYELLRSLEHPHIVRAFDLVQAGSCAMLVLEFFHGATLEKAVHGEPGRSLPEVVSKGLSRMLLQAVDYLHQHRVLHRDVKPQNVLVSQDMKDLRLADFNTAHRLAAGGALTMTGTQEYLPPEVLLGDSPSELSDIWAVGLCLHFMLCGRLPRHPGHYASREEFGQAVAARPVSLTKAPWKNVSEPCKGVLRSCLEVRKALRPAAMTLLEHEWFRGASSSTPRGGGAKTPKCRPRHIDTLSPAALGRVELARKRARSSPR